MIALKEKSKSVQNRFFSKFCNHLFKQVWQNLFQIPHLFKDCYECFHSGFTTKPPTVVADLLNTASFAIFNIERAQRISAVVGEYMGSSRNLILSTGAIGGILRKAFMNGFRSSSKCSFHLSSFFSREVMKLPLHSWTTDLVLVFLPNKMFTVR